MKNKLLLLILLALPAIGFSQTEEDTLFRKFIRVNLAVPDLPAFNALGNSPSDILRPSDVKALSILTSEFYNGSSIIVPKSFAMEVAPFLLAKSNSLTLHDYEKNKLLYNLRISLGTNTTTANNQTYSNLAIGARLTLIDEGDLKNDKKFKEKLYKSTTNEVKIEGILKEEFFKINKLNPFDITNDTTGSLEKKMEDYISINKLQRAKELKLSYIEDISKLREEFKEHNWNKQKLEFAYAYLGSSPDSLIKNIQSKKHSAWLTGAFPVGRWGQLLGGLNYSYIYADSLNKEKTVNYEYNTFSVSSRLYFGTNRIKGFVEGQYKSISLNSKKDAFVNAGGEFNVRDGIWLVVNAGVNWHDIGSSNSKSGFYSSLNLRFTLPENFKLN